MRLAVFAVLLLQVFGQVASQSTLRIVNTAATAVRPTPRVAASPSGRVLLTLAPSVRNSNQSLAVLGLTHIRTLATLGNLVVAKPNSDKQGINALVTKLAGHSDVLHIEPDQQRAVFYLDNPSGYEQYSLSKIQSDCLFNSFAQAGHPYAGSTTYVCVADTGIDTSHPDLHSQLYINKGEIPNNGIDDDGNGFVDDVHGYNFVAKNGNVTDDNGHGTHVSGSIAAAKNGIGTLGVSPTLGGIIACKFLSAAGSGYLSDELSCLDYCKKTFNKLKATTGQTTGIYSASFGSSSSSIAETNAIAALDLGGVTRGLLVAAAGNSGQSNEIGKQPIYPASYTLTNIISVAASTANDTLALYSNFGHTAVDLAAPGDQILSSWPNMRLAYLSGTSMATPHVSVSRITNNSRTGVAAILHGASPSATSASLKAFILQSVDKLAAFSGKTVTGGRLNAFSALKRLLGVQGACNTDNVYG